MAKKDSAEAKEPTERKQRKKRAKGNFGIFVEESVEDVEPRARWVEVVSGLPSAAACDKHIKENVDDFKGKKIMLAQIKKVGEIEVETKVKVSF